MHQMQSHARPDRFCAAVAPSTEQIPSTQAKVLRRQEPDSDLVAGNFVGQQLTNGSFKTGRIAGLGALFASGPLGLDLLGWRFRATGVEFFFANQSR